MPATQGLEMLVRAGHPYRMVVKDPTGKPLGIYSSLLGPGEQSLVKENQHVGFSREPKANKWELIKLTPYKDFKIGDQTTIQEIVFEAKRTLEIKTIRILSE